VFTDFKARVRLFPVVLDDGEVSVQVRERPDAASTKVAEEREAVS
jgi:hypothetical protein